MVEPLEFTQDDASVRVTVHFSRTITLGLYSGPLTKRDMAEAVRSLVLREKDNHDAFHDMVDRITIDAVILDEDETALVEAV